MKTTKRAAGYTINHEDQTIIITRDYAKKSSIPGSKEFRELAKLHAAYPDYVIQRRTANVSENKQKHSGLTISRMEKFVQKFGTEEEKEAFAAVKEFYEGERCYYGKMKSWFLKKYPEYEEVDFAA